VCTINRSALILRPRKPYFDWTSGVDEGAAETVAARAESAWITVYLVEQDPEGRMESAPLEDYFSEIFEMQLGGWYRDEKVWPQVRTIEVFRDWFEVDATSTVEDLGRGNVRYDDY
jgi:hypothetical protein